TSLKIGSSFSSIIIISRSGGVLRIRNLPRWITAVLSSKVAEYSTAKVDTMETVGTGFATVDLALGGLITGDNVVWINDGDDVYSRLCDGFVRAAQAHGQRTVHVTFGGGRRLDPAGVEVLDASPTGRFSRPVTLADEL